MALDGTYSGLQASVADFLNRADLTASIPDFITLAEGQMLRRMVAMAAKSGAVPRRLVRRSDATISIGAEYVAVPTDFFGPLEFTLNSTPQTDLDYLENQNLQREKKLARWIGAPKYYTVVGGELQIFPVADQAYTGELTYIYRPAALSATNTTNWILTDYPDAYLYGALTASAPYLKDDARANVWGTLFTAAIEDICNADPMPTEKTTLRTEIAALQRYGFPGVYNINTDC